MFAIRLDAETEARLNKLSSETHRPKAFYVKKALAIYLEDLEDIYLAEKELENIKLGKSSLTSLEDLKRELGI
ncbi:MAG: hypothetical protein RL027_640 [Pseudomonadota bacterium]|jgi:RHH-type rel operon transcriptional repressor/antitoxin RelB